MQTLKKNYFLESYLRYSEFLANTNLSPQAKVVFLAVREIPERFGEDATVDLLCDYLDWHRNTVVNRVNELEKVGYVKTDFRGCKGKIVSPCNCGWKNPTSRFD